MTPTIAEQLADLQRRVEELEAFHKLDVIQLRPFFYSDRLESYDPVDKANNGHIAAITRVAGLGFGGGFTWIPAQCLGSCQRAAKTLGFKLEIVDD